MGDEAGDAVGIGAMKTNPRTCWFGSAVFSDARTIDAVVILDDGHVGRLDCESSCATGTSGDEQSVAGSVVDGAFSVECIDRCVLLLIESR